MVKQSSTFLWVVGLCAFAESCAAQGEVPSERPVNVAESVEIRELATGDGETAVRGRSATVHYSGWLADGRKFDSSHDRGEPLRFTLGNGNVVAGFERGVLGMRVGGKRRVSVPAALAYGSRGNPGAFVPADSALVFELELVRLD